MTALKQSPAPGAPPPGLGGPRAAADRRHRRGGAGLPREIHPPRRLARMEGGLPRGRGLGRRPVRGLLQLAPLPRPRRQRLHRGQVVRAVERRHPPDRVRLRPRPQGVHQRRRLVPQRRELHLLLPPRHGRPDEPGDDAPRPALRRLLLGEDPEAPTTTPGTGSCARRSAAAGGRGRAPASTTSTTTSSTGTPPSGRAGNPRPRSGGRTSSCASRSTAVSTRW